MIKIDKKLQNIYHTYYDSLIVQDLWQTHYQILWKINLDMIIKNVKHVELNISIVTVFLNTRVLKTI